MRRPCQPGRERIAAFDSRFKGQTEEKSDRGLLRRTRRDVARIRTILREREIGDAAKPGAATAVAVAAPVKAAPAKAAGKKAAGKTAPATEKTGGGKKRKE